MIRSALENFSLPNPGNITQAFQQGLQTGQKEREEREVRGALTAYAMNPDDPEAFGVLAQRRPELAISIRQERDQAALLAEQRAAQKAATAKQSQRSQAMEVADLFDEVADDPSYQQALGAAQRLGIDLSDAPPAYDAAWIGQQQVITRALADKPEKITNDARMLIEAGYEPDSPEFEQAMVGIINNKYASEYVDDAGNVRRRTALNLPGNPRPSATAPPNEAVSDLRKNPDTAAEFDEIFGKGAAASILGEGGQTSPASGGFPE